MIVMLTDILTTIVLPGFLLLSITKIVVALDVFPDCFPDPGEHFPDVCVNPRVIEPGTPVTPGHDSYLGGSHCPGLKRNLIKNLNHTRLSKV